jgi:hypothetical protein
MINELEEEDMEFSGEIIDTDEMDSDDDDVDRYRR